jgi:hypothetical protein
MAQTRATHPRDDQPRHCRRERCPRAVVRDMRGKHLYEIDPPISPAAGVCDHTRLRTHSADVHKEHELARR